MGRDWRVSIETLRGLYEGVEGGDGDAEEASSEEETPYVSPRVMNKKVLRLGKGSLRCKRAPQVGVISIHEPNLKPIDGGNSAGDVKGILESLKKRVEVMEAGLASGVQDDEEEESESGVSAQPSDGNHNGTSSGTETDHKTNHQHPRNDDEFTFPAPEDLKMDTKPEPTKTRISSSNHGRSI